LAYGYWKDVAALTAELVIVDDYQITWAGLPGYVNNNYPGFLFPPQSEHKWSGNSLSEILLDRYPLSNGPYRILDWENEDTLHLGVNPYFDGKTPGIDRIVIRFPDVDPVFWDEMYLSGYCDLLLPGDMVNHNWLNWIKLVEQDHAVMWHSASSTILRLDFNVAPSSFILREQKTRLGLANCVSRGHLSQLTPDALTLPATSFIPENHPTYNPASVWRVPYDIEVGRGILEEVGWVDEDNDGIRESHDVPGIRDNTPLTLTLTTSSHDILAAEVLQEDLKACGVGIEIEAMGPHQLFAASGVSPLYTRNFELALYQWDAHIPEGCSAWLSYLIPGNTEAGGEYNYSGFTSSVFDEACLQAIEALDQTQLALALNTTQAILSEELPTLFLVWEPLWLISRPELKNIVPDATAFGRLYQPQGIFRERQ
jgi:ABC-type transport system substrate-binding protein